jgi:DNA-3-methyladenine glycosylase II
MIAAIRHLKECDPVMHELISRVGPYKQQFSAPTFCALVRGIVYQQLNGRAAATIFGRLEEACGEPGVCPERLVKLRPDRLRKCGLSSQKSAYVLDLARKTKSGEIVFSELPRLGDNEVLQTLTAVKGVGPWTAQMFLLFALRRPDIWATGDYGLRVAVQKLYTLDGLPKPQEMERIAEPWRPWRSIASWYLWRSHDLPTTVSPTTVSKTSDTVRGAPAET